MNTKVFLSYSQYDRDLVEPAIAQLSGFGIDSPIEPLEADISAGEDFRAKIRDRVQSASRVVVFWSKSAATSKNVQYELGMADALDKPITIVQLDRTKPELPAHLSDKIVHIEDLFTHNPRHK